MTRKTVWIERFDNPKLNRYQFRVCADFCVPSAPRAMQLSPTYCATTSKEGATMFDLSPYLSFDAFTVVALLAIALLATRGADRNDNDKR